MKSIFWIMCLLTLVRPSTELSAQVNPYKEGNSWGLRVSI